ncbi:hypothetical protein LTR53_013900 [Teratosphaeriaceae sp. CCFEE 6253]|nr:hypothetical protein LTR53_013900 [Teratosphaeriaceae sp. CCFEE 6253]
MAQTTRDSRSESPVLARYKEHCSRTRVNTPLTAVEIVRAMHPGRHVTTVDSDDVDLVGYAEAGHAEAKSISTGIGHLSERTYHAPTTRMEPGQGTLTDDVKIGQYDYRWNEQDFTVYLISWSDDYEGRQSFHYIVSDEDSDGKIHSSLADALVLACGKWTSELHEEIYVFDDGSWDKNGELWKAVQQASWDDVILDPAMKKTLIDDVHGFFNSRALYAEFAVTWKRGIIMHGTLGCGKTISIKALMHSLQELNVASLYVKSFEACSGSQNSINWIFRRAREMAPCLLIFEDLDSLVKDDVRSYFLNEVDGIESNEGICMIGSTNHLERLDPGISKRPSRFDRKYHYSLPGHRERVLYGEFWRKKLAQRRDLGFSDEVCDIVATLTEDFSFAYLKELFAEDDELSEVAVFDAASSTKAIEDSAKLVKDGEKTESSSDEPSGEDKVDGQKQEAKAARQSRKVPDVNIPEHLRDNALLRVLMKQVVALIQDMDNMEDDDKKSKPKIV